QLLIVGAIKVSFVSTEARSTPACFQYGGKFRVGRMKRCVEGKWIAGEEPIQVINNKRFRFCFYVNLEVSIGSPPECGVCLLRVAIADDLITHTNESFIGNIVSVSFFIL